MIDRRILTMLLCAGCLGAGTARPTDPQKRWQADRDLREAAEVSELARLKRAIWAGADLDTKDVHDNTPLHWAARGGETDAAELLLAFGANPNVRNEWGLTPMHLAAWRGDSKMFQLLSRFGGDPTMWDIIGRSPADLAIRSNHKDMMPVIETATVNFKWNRRQQVARVPEGVVDAIDGRKTEKPWQEGHPLLWAAKYGDLNDVNKALAAGADPNVNDELGAPLAVAVRRGNLEIAQLLLDHGAKADPVDGFQETPLKSVAWSSHANLPMIALLLSHGADLTFKPGAGDSPMQIIEDTNENLAALLKATPQQINTPDDQGRAPLHRVAHDGRKEYAMILIARGADVKAARSDGWTPLHIAACAGNVEVAEVLIAKGADVNGKDPYGLTPLCAAGTEKITELLLKHGADLKIRDKTGQTPLHWAAGNGNRAVVAAMIAHGASRTAKDQFGRTPLDVSKEQRVTGMEELLVAKAKAK